MRGQRAELCCRAEVSGLSEWWSLACSGWCRICGPRVCGLSWGSFHHVPKDLSISWAPGDPQLLIFLSSVVVDSSIVVRLVKKIA